MLLTLFAAACLAQEPNACEKLAHTNFAKTQITAATSVAAGTLQLPPGPFGPTDTSKGPAFCRVQGTLHPSADSDIGFEVWMPNTGWNGRYLQLGNGGLAGQIDTSGLFRKLAMGYAVAATDDGHKGIPTDGSWAMGHPEKVKDFGYRAVHETSEIAKKLITAFYGSTAKYAYFNGCSEGGREAMMEAQRYPRDFNGILAGSTAHYWTQLMANFAWNAQALNSKESFIPEAKRPAIEKAALAACPNAKGVDDKFIDDPMSCRFDASVLLCKKEETNECLTSPQLEALKKIYAGPKNSVTGAQVSPGYEPGAEAEPGFPGVAYASYVFGNGPGMSLDAMFSSSFYGSFVFQDPKWTFAAFNFGSDIATVEKAVGAEVNADNPDLSGLKLAGGKLLHYHGWYDGSPTPLHSVNYYEAVERKMGGVAPTQAFYRLYMVPGMMHCGMGPGPNIFGNAFDMNPPPDALHNIQAALEQWVEQGKAPDALIATKYVDDNPAKGVAITRPLCAYPKVAKWNGKQNPSDAGSWQCAAADQPTKSH